MSGRALALALGVLADHAIGDPPTRIHPVGLVGLAARGLQRAAPAAPEPRRRYGAAVALALPLAAALSAAVTRYSAARRGAAAGMLADVTLFHSTTALHNLLARACEVQSALDHGLLTEARELLGRHLVSRDTTTLDTADVAAATIASVAENLSDGVVAPWIAFTIDGAPTGAAYRAGNTLDALWGYRDAVFEDLGRGAARLDDLLNLVPARLTALALMLAAWSAGEARGYDARGALETWRRDATATASPNAGHPMATMAGALGVELSKPGVYTIGGHLPRPAPLDIGRAVRLARTAANIVGGGLLVRELIR